MPAPHALRLGIGARKVRRVGQDSVREDRGKMFERAGRGELHDRRSPLRPGDGASGAVLGRDYVVARVARLPVVEDMFARVGLLLQNGIVDQLADRTSVV